MTERSNHARKHFCSSARSSNLCRFVFASLFCFHCLVLVSLHPLKAIVHSEMKFIECSMYLFIQSLAISGHFWGFMLKDTRCRQVNDFKLCVCFKCLTPQCAFFFLHLKLRWLKNFYDLGKDYFFSFIDIIYLRNSINHQGLQSW